MASPYSSRIFAQVILNLSILSGISQVLSACLSSASEVGRQKPSRERPRKVGVVGRARGRGWGQVRVTTAITARAAPPPTCSLPIPTPTARVRTRRERGGAEPPIEAEGRVPWPERRAGPGDSQVTPVPLRWRATGQPRQPALPAALSSLGLSAPLPHRARRTKQDPGGLSHCSGRPSHQAVLCQLPQESKCRTFPAKTCLCRAVVNAHTFAVKRSSARCPLPLLLSLPVWGFVLFCLLLR